jgi:hypothetical protein
MRKRTVYICGPMRGIPEFNFPAFDAAAARFRAAGWDVISPAEMDRSHGLNEKGHTGKDVFTNDEIRAFIHRDYGAIVGTLRAENGDALAVLPGWHNSVGGTPNCTWPGGRSWRFSTPRRPTPSASTSRQAGADRATAADGHDGGPVPSAAGAGPTE